MTALLKDPRLFAVLLMILMLAQAGRWAVERKWADTGYWVLSTLLTALVTFGFKR